MYDSVKMRFSYTGTTDQMTLLEATATQIMIGVALVAATSGCSASPESTSKLTVQASSEKLIPADPEMRLPGISWLDEKSRKPLLLDAKHVERLDGPTIKALLTGKGVGMGTSGQKPDYIVSLTEYYRKDGTWSWWRRVPDTPQYVGQYEGGGAKSGKWLIANDQLCVSSPFTDAATMTCRYVWRDRKSGLLLMYDLGSFDKNAKLFVHRVG
jgi:hypothetical protein